MKNKLYLCYFYCASWWIFDFIFILVLPHHEVWQIALKLLNNYSQVYCARQQKRHRCVEQSFGLCGRGRGGDDLGEWHWNTYNIIYEMNCQSRFIAGYWVLGAGALGWPRGMVWGGKRERGSWWGTRVYLWQIHVDVWQNQYNIVK